MLQVRLFPSAVAHRGWGERALVIHARPRTYGITGVNTVDICLNLWTSPKNVILHKTETYLRVRLQVQRDLGRRARHKLTSQYSINTLQKITRMYVSPLAVECVIFAPN